MTMCVANTHPQMNSIQSVIDNLQDRLSLPYHINREALISALRQLDELIGMTSAKESVVKTLKYILMTSNESHMHHCVLSGPPGVGKTTLGKILAQLYVAMGILRTPRKVEQDIDTFVRVVLDSESDINYIHSALVRVNGRYRSDNQGVEAAIFRTQTAKVRLAIAKEMARQLAPKKTVDVDSSPFVVATRTDFVAKYLGQTEDKTKKLLERCRGKVLFIDEAYTLMTDERDSFGMQALTTLNQFMSEYPNDLIVIFAGYKDLLDQTIFHHQPGLKRRVAWTHEIEGYTAEEMVKIFDKMCLKDRWSIDDNGRVRLKELVQRHKDDFKHFGGDCERLLFQCKLEKASVWFETGVNDRIIDEGIVTRGYDGFKKSLPKREESGAEHMYL